MTTSIIVAYPHTKESLAVQLDKLRGHTFTTPALYKEGVKAIATCRQFRVEIEERRKLLKQDSLEYGRKVDAVAKELVGIIEGIEKPLKEAKQLVDDEKERVKREAALAEQRAVEERIRAERAAEEAALKEQRQAEEARLAEERKLMEAQRKAMAEERAALQAERDAAAKELAEFRAKQAAAKAEKDAQERAERLAAEAEEARLNALEFERQRQKRLAALQPDQHKLDQLAQAIRHLVAAHSDLEFESDAAVQAADTALGDIESVAQFLEAWKERQQ